jgi:hypothetical protein
MPIITTFERWMRSSSPRPDVSVGGGPAKNRPPLARRESIDRPDLGLR